MNEEIEVHFVPEEDQMNDDDYHNNLDDDDDYIDDESDGVCLSDTEGEE